MNYRDRILLLIVILSILILSTCKPLSIKTNRNTLKLREEHTEITLEHSVDSIQYNTEIGLLKAEIVDLKGRSKEVEIRYVTIYKEHLANPTDTVIIKEVIEVCNNLVEEQAEIIVVQDSTIVTQEEYIVKQENTITDLNGLADDSHELLDKSQRKLKRTRRIGLISSSAGILTGIFLGLKL